MTAPVDLVRAALEQAWTADCQSDIYLARQVVELRERVAELEAAAGAHPVGDYACTVCGGHGTVMDPGYYVPGEQFVEPPHEDACPACAGTGGRDVQRIVDRVAKLESVALAARALTVDKDDDDALLDLGGALAALDEGPAYCMSPVASFSGSAPEMCVLVDGHDGRCRA